jgi:hypothetical protein
MSFATVYTVLVLEYSCVHWSMYLLFSHAVAVEGNMHGNMHDAQGSKSSKFTKYLVCTIRFLRNSENRFDSLSRSTTAVVHTM